MIGRGGELGATCSRAGCNGSAEFNVNWRNPRIHGLDRVKVWLACGDHREFLEQYLSSRGFPVIVSPLSETVSVVPDGAGHSSSASGQ